eukprot:scaffold11862_cov74-Cyclotella_meneghiniana.AAC.4
MLLLPYSQPSKVLLGTVGANRRGVVNVEWDLDADKTLAEGVTNSDFINRIWLLSMLANEHYGTNAIIPLKLFDKVGGTIWNR